MEDFLKRLKKFNQVEFIVVTLLLIADLITISSADTGVIDVIDNYYGRIISYSSSYARELTQTITLYLSFVLLSMFVVPKLLEKKFIRLNIGLILVVSVALGIV